MENKKSIIGHMSTTSFEMIWPWEKGIDPVAEIKFDLDANDYKEALEFVKWVTYQERKYASKVKVTLELIREDEQNGI